MFHGIDNVYFEQSRALSTAVTYGMKGNKVVYDISTTACDLFTLRTGKNCKLQKDSF